MNVEALDHDAALAGIEGRAGEQLGRYFLWIDIVEHNGGVVAAELQREVALQQMPKEGFEIGVLDVSLAPCLSEPIAEVFEDKINVLIIAWRHDRGGTVR